MSNLRILVADDHEIVRCGLVSLIGSHRGWEVCAEAENGRMAVSQAKELKPDIAILDIGMPILNGLEATKEILRDNPQVKVLILTLLDAERVIQATRDAGARGYILKSDASRVLVVAIQALEYDNTFFTSRVAQMVHGGYLENVHSAKKKRMVVPSLGPREREVLQLLAEGESTKQVAGLLNIRPRTADSHRSNIMRKLGTHKIVGLVMYAIRNGIMQVPVSDTDAETSASSTI
ncbi:MAG: response regulator transcription factor [Terriglobales bacterium]